MNLRKLEKLGSAVKSTGGPRFLSQQWHGGSRPFLTPVPGDPTPYSRLHTTCLEYTHIHAGKTATYINKGNIIYKKGEIIQRLINTQEPYI